MCSVLGMFKALSSPSKKKLLMQLHIFNFQVMRGVNRKKGWFSIVVLDVVLVKYINNYNDIVYTT